MSQADGINGTIASSSSESDLSEASDLPNLPAPADQEDPLENGYLSKSSSPSSRDEDAVGSDDADYEMESPPPLVVHVTHESDSSSEGSRRPSKRKAPTLNDEEHMKNNPELYGIRRSVGF
jgi:chromodomain-helicase-DNA-binding protein 1